MADNETTEGHDVSLTTGAIELNIISALAAVQAEVKGVGKSVDSLVGTVGGMDTRLRTVESDVSALKARPEIDPHLGDRVTTLEANQTFVQQVVNALQATQTDSRITWPKIFAAVGGIGAFIVLANVIGDILPAAA